MIKLSQSILSCVLLLSIACPSLYAQEGGILGQKAPSWPELSWIDEEGNPTRNHTLEEYKGKWMYLYFFQSWCPGCHSHGFPTLQKIQKEFGSHERVAILSMQTVFEGFGVNTEKKVAEIQKRYKLKIPMAHDPGTKEIKGSQLMRRYMSMGTPWAVVINPEGIVVFNDFHANGDAVIGLIKEDLENRVSSKVRPQ